jgi:hypothetical protein
MDHGGWLENTSRSAVLVALPDHRVLVAVPNRDFVLRPRSWFYVTEWDADLSVALVPLPAGRGIPLECDSRRCHTRIPGSYRDSCWPVLVAIEPSRVRVLQPTLQPDAVRESVQWIGRLAGNGAWEVEFSLPAELDRPADLVAVATCFPASGYDAHGIAISSANPSPGPAHAVVTDSFRLDP